MKFPPSGRWRFAVDRGGTFTDVIGIDPAGRVLTAKLLSQSSLYRDAAVEGIRRLHKRTSGDLKKAEVAGIRMGTTVATNALLERRGTPTALLITAGFEDLLEIGNQARPEIFSLRIRKPEVLYDQVVGIPERINAQGVVEKPLDEEEARRIMENICSQGFRSLAVVLMHAWKNPAHERILAALARRAGLAQVSVSHEVMPLIKIVGRGQTTLVDAYLALVLREYLEQVRTQVPHIPIEFMKSSGGLVPADHLRAKDTILSGPAGGVIGYAALARQLGIEEAIGFDMGGTSTDVSRFGGEFERVFETTVGGIQYQTDQLDVETVAAGGGSILAFEGGKFVVGPESAGADPGPACYGQGGPLTVTDANLILGRILPEYMPTTFGPHQDKVLDTTAARKGFTALTRRVNRRLEGDYSVSQVAEGFIRVANQIMGRAINRISVARGYDLRRHTLLCFGGAAPQHACAIARTLGIRRIVIHPLAGVFSAYGIALADRIERAARAVMSEFTPQCYRGQKNRITRLKAQLAERFPPTEGKGRVRFRIFLDLRPLGSDTYLTIPAGRPGRTLPFIKVLESFRERYRHQFGFAPAENPVELVNLRLEAVLPGRRLAVQQRPAPEIPLSPDQAALRHQVYFDGRAQETSVFVRSELKNGHWLTGPAIVVEEYSTIVVEPGFRLQVNHYGQLAIEEIEAAVLAVTPSRDPVLLEVFNHLFMSVAEQMGYTLANTAHSVNMKERLDFSCALFDQRGNLVANAPHIPVHLGAMGESVKYILAQNRGQLRPGDAYVTNNPHHGGSHLPDVTVVSPVFAPGGDLIFLVASRGHHADIGGITPGSMPPFGTRLEEEGVVIDNFLLVSEGQFRHKEILKLLSSGPYPARNLKERLSDLQAQVAANNKGIRELKRVVEGYSLEVVAAYMDHIQDNAAEAMAEALGSFLVETDLFERYYEDFLDDGARTAVTLRIGPSGRTGDVSCRMTVDFTGTAPEVPGNLNAPVAVTVAAVLYVLRTLIERDIPLNAGCLRAVEIIIPEGSLLNPSPQAAVVGGNVETSQRVVDTLYGALGVAAASQGTMNNFLFGRPDGSGQQYYETVAGGAGAVDGHPGASAVQVHMTNTRITDPEVLEYRFPEVQVGWFRLRRGSGGDGAWKGGEGVERAIRFGAPLQVSILSERRNYPPYGMAGGSPGLKGANWLIRRDGTRLALEGKVSRLVEAGETILIQTPGGGGFGAP